PENPTPSDTTAAPETTADPYPDDLPDDLDFGGKPVTFLYREEVSNEFYTDEQTGDVVNDAQFNSLRAVEERLNVNIEAVLRPGHMNAVQKEYMNHITNTILAGDSLYDWVDLMIGHTPVMMKSGIFNDLLQNPYIDVDKPYYLGKLDETATIHDKLYFIAGDFSMGYLNTTYGMYFNTRLAEEYHTGNLYTLVDEGKWTIDKLIELAKMTCQDINNDGKYDDNDQLGFLVHDKNHPKCFWASTLTTMYDQDENGEWQYTFGTERDVDVLNKIYNLLYNTEGSYYTFVTDSAAAYLDLYNSFTKKFTSGEVFIFTCELDDAVTQLRTMEDDYGLLPFPKMDETQDNYYSLSRNTHNAFSMPITCKDPELAGAVLEALASSNHDTVMPAFFEVALKTKYSRDTDSARMFDLIRSGTILDFGYIFNNALGNPESVFYDSITKENSLASNVAANKTALDTALSTYMTEMREIS
ncbi:MAG: hypothetical protein IJF67_14450, partial [Clostridia bacterium]|nr:hypothetical protein [Clostridia bacterium]